MARVISELRRVQPPPVTQSRKPKSLNTEDMTPVGEAISGTASSREGVGRAKVGPGRIKVLEKLEKKFPKIIELLVEIGDLHDQQLEGFRRQLQVLREDIGVERRKRSDADAEVARWKEVVKDTQEKADAAEVRAAQAEVKIELLELEAERARKGLLSKDAELRFAEEARTRDRHRMASAAAQFREQLVAFEAAMSLSETDGAGYGGNLRGVQDDLQLQRSDTAIEHEGGSRGEVPAIEFSATSAVRADANARRCRHDAGPSFVIEIDIHANSGAHDAGDHRRCCMRPGCFTGAGLGSPPESGRPGSS